MTKATIHPARSPEDLRAVAALFADYAAWLPIDLGYQGFEAELAGLPGKYAAPEGELLLVRGADGLALGCVGLRPLADDGICEMKRLFVAPRGRGLGIGRSLAQAIVESGRVRGYRAMRLDTLASMTGPIALYERMGFTRIPAYYAPTPEGTVFMELRL